MKRTLLYFALCATSSLGYAEQAVQVAPPPPPPATPPAIPFPDEAPPAYADKDRVALAIAKEWKEAPTVPVLGADGRILYRFGETLPTVVCVPTQVTDIELEVGEIVKPEGLHMGDTVRWAVLPSISGPEGATITHLICKPTAPNLTTSFVCTTDRRTYHIRLVSSSDLNEWMPYVAFTYPENARLQWAAYAEAQQKAQARATLPEARGPGKSATLGELDFAYRITGTAEWCPIRVYNDGVKTIIQMPKSMMQTEAPVLLVIGADKKEQLVNYRVHDDRYIVDQLFAKAEMISGVGRRQLRVTITRTNSVPAADAPGIQHKR